MGPPSKTASEHILEVTPALGSTGRLRSITENVAWTPIWRFSYPPEWCKTCCHPLKLHWSLWSAQISHKYHESNRLQSGDDGEVEIFLKATASLSVATRCCLLSWLIKFCSPLCCRRNFIHLYDIKSDPAVCVSVQCWCGAVTVSCNPK